ncbi:MAG: glycosyltransferase [Sulfuricellaceae bacterium]|nr:glycosyltransferase [Sulfuricellaceae bacterium]
MTTTEVIDILIPVYNAYEDLRRCVNSVRRHAGEQCRLVLINDASPDPRIAQYFEELSAENDSLITLLQNPENLGFVGTVNRAMSLSSNDVVLLNSDTIVTAGWLEKLRRCAQSDSSIGTITPFSNNAEICSFPDMCVNNPLPPGLDAEAINRAIERAAAPLYPDIPTGVGFCMFIRRALLNRIGLFDAETFGLGYGEENDFCMRAMQTGYRNVLCDDTYILHVGNSSFDSKKQVLAQENMQHLVRKHPDYLKIVTSFIAADPIRPIREVARSFLAVENPDRKSGVLHVLHGRKGGTENHIRHLMAAGNERFRQYLLATFDDVWILEDAAGEQLASYHFKHEQDELWASLLEGICAAFDIQFCHVHHLAGCRIGLLEAFGASNIPYGFTVHDFYLACPSINLLNGEGEFCDAQTDPGNCQRCLEKQKDYAGVEITEWRRAHQHFLDKAAFVIAPSAWAGTTFARYFSSTKIQVIPHGSGHQGEIQDDAPCSALLLPNDGVAHIAVLGAIGPVKGARRLEKLVARTRERKLALRWVVVGYLDRQFNPHQDKDKVLTIHGHYHPEDVGLLLDHYRSRLTVFPSAGPETYCFTLTESWEAGKPALVPPIGALGERVSASGAGWLMDDWQNEDGILDQILSILHPENSADFERVAKAAVAVPVFTIDDMARKTEAAYPAVLGKQSLAPLSNRRLLDAMKTALGKNGEAATQRNSRQERWFLVFAHAALRIRYTFLGRWLYKVVPVHWQQRVKRRLLGLPPA